MAAQSSDWLTVSQTHVTASFQAVSQYVYILHHQWNNFRYKADQYLFVISQVRRKHHNSHLNSIIHLNTCLMRPYTCAEMLYSYFHTLLFDDTNSTWSSEEIILLQNKLDIECVDLEMSIGVISVSTEVFLHFYDTTCDQISLAKKWREAGRILQGISHVLLHILQKNFLIAWHAGCDDLIAYLNT